MYDFVIRSLRICIEYHGTYWHPKPETTKDSWKNNHISYDDANIRDSRKASAIKELGYSYTVVWEDNCGNDVANSVFEFVKSEYDKK